MERSTIFGKIHYKWPFPIAMLVYQRVTKTWDFPKSRWPVKSLTTNQHLSDPFSLGLQTPLPWQMA
jgi:hypothetical protein